MKLHFSDERLLAVVAHPDDAELLCAGTLARARQDGAETAVCVLCQGDKGQPAQFIENLADVRRKELIAATTLLGAQLFTGYVPDGTLSDDPQARPRLMDIFRQFRPTLVLAHSPTDYHPDHRAASRLCAEVSWYAASAGQQTGDPPLAAQPAVWWMDTLNMLDFEPSIYIDVSEFVAKKEQMLAAHKSQLERRGDEDFAPLMDLMQNQLRTRGSQAGVLAAEAFRPYAAFKRLRAW